MTKITYTIITIAIIFLPCWFITLGCLDHYNKLTILPWVCVDSIGSENVGSFVRKETITVDEPYGDSADSKIASWYDYDLVGYPNYSKYTSTCASRDYPRKTILKVTNLKNGKSVECRVNDWIEHPDRNLDLSSFAFKQLAPLTVGLLDVTIEQIKVGKTN